MASIEEQHPMYNDDDLDDDDVIADEEDDDVDVDYDDDSTSSPPPPPALPICTNSAAGEVTVAVVGVPASGGSLQVNVAPVSVDEKKPSAAFDDSRKLFQRLWTDEDEIELLQGFLEYTTQRGGINSSSNHHDTTAFYDQIKSKLQLDFNRSQLVEKLRRLKKKYRNVMSKMGSGKDFVFKSSHDQATFQISRQIWSNVVVRGGGGGAAAAPPPPPEYGGIDDEDSHINLNANFIDHSPNIFNFNPNGTDLKTPKWRKRSRGAVKIEEKSFVQQYYQQSSGGEPTMVLPISSAVSMPVPTPMTIPIQMAAPQGTTAPPARAGSIPTLIEDTVRCCLSPIFKELLNNVTNLNGSRSFGLAMASTLIPLGFGSSSMRADMMSDEKWRKQQILELEVYSKRLELVQDQIKAQLEELRSMNNVDGKR